MISTSNTSIRTKLTGRKTGPGGWGCPCCAPKPGKDAKDFKRTLKRIEKQHVEKHIQREVNEINSDNI